MKNSTFKKRKPLKRTPFKARKQKLRVAGKSTVSELKREIQSLLRQIVMLRDKGCILRMERCGHEVGMEGVVFQADHLITRANSATYADPRLVVCVCRNCHFWKKYHEKEYNLLVRSILPESVVELWDKCEIERLSHRPHKMDWVLEIIALKNELKRYDR